MKHLIILLVGIFGCILLLGLIGVGFYLLNSELQNTGVFRDIHQAYNRDEGDPYWKWGGLHYICEIIEIAIVIFTIIVSIVFSIKYYKDYIY